MVAPERGSVCEAPAEGYSRPQFFSGQLLTDDDLQSLADYTVAKNRLHNRMLFGEGVACGLRVSMDDCENERHLIVRPGYAIDCCGNDIVVPCEMRLDVVQLVRDLRARMLGKDCGDPCREPVEYDCPERQPTDQQSDAAPAVATHVVGDVRPDDSGAKPPGGKRTSYCLYLVYCEQPADPVAPYDGADSCGGGECLPTRIREGYRFELRCATPSGCEPDKRIDPKRRFYSSLIGMAERVLGLLKSAKDNLTSDIRTSVLDVLENMIEVTGACESDQRKLIQEASSPKMGKERFNSIVAQLLLRLLRKADCNAMLSDCPPCDEDAVLIACFDFEECKVTNLCSARRLQILSPAYFAQLSFTHAWRCLLMGLCCGSDKYASGDTLEKAVKSVSDRREHIYDVYPPEVRFTLQPELIKAYDSNVTRAAVEDLVSAEVLRATAELRGELDKVTRALAEIKGVKFKKGDNP
ncbi:hypothetical protein [Paraburkholderia terrae]